MVWWLLNKDNLHRKNHKRLNSLESSLKNSFFNIKKDVFKLTHGLSLHDTHISHIKERLDRVEALLHEIQKIPRSSVIITEKEEQKKKKEEPQLQPLISSKPILEHLTTVQKNILFRLGTLHTESNNSWVIVKTLIEELYPDKEYYAVRSMVSEYLDILMDFGLVKKMRKGKISYVRLTNRGIGIFDEAKQNKLIGIISNKVQNI